MLSSPLFLPPTLFLFLSLSLFFSPLVAFFLPSLPSTNCHCQHSWNIPKHLFSFSIEFIQQSMYKWAFQVYIYKIRSSSFLFFFIIIFFFYIQEEKKRIICYITIRWWILIRLHIQWELRLFLNICLKQVFFSFFLFLSRHFFALKLQFIYQRKTIIVIEMINLMLVFENLSDGVSIQSNKYIHWSLLVNLIDGSNKRAA